MQSLIKHKILRTYLYIGFNCYPITNHKLYSTVLNFPEKKRKVNKSSELNKLIPPLKLAKNKAITPRRRRYTVPTSGERYIGARASIGLYALLSRACDKTALDFIDRSVRRYDTSSSLSLSRFIFAAQSERQWPAVIHIYVLSRGVVIYMRCLLFIGAFRTWSFAFSEAFWETWCFIFGGDVWLWFFVVVRMYILARIITLLIQVINYCIKILILI